MAKKNILITGGVGFIGSHVGRVIHTKQTPEDRLADEMLSHRHFVRVLDNLVAQTHGKRPACPRHLRHCLSTNVFVNTQRRAPATRVRLAELEKSHAE